MAVSCERVTLTCLRAMSVGCLALNGYAIQRITNTYSCTRRLRSSSSFSDRPPTSFPSPHLSTDRGWVENSVRPQNDDDPASSGTSNLDLINERDSPRFFEPLAPPGDYDGTIDDLLRPLGGAVVGGAGGTVGRRHGRTGTRRTDAVGPRRVCGQAGGRARPDAVEAAGAGRRQTAAAAAGDTESSAGSRQRRRWTCRRPCSVVQTLFRASTLAAVSS